MTITQSGFFITATDTGVGKTVIAAALGMILRDKGYDVGVMKPVQSGGVIKKGKLVSEDAGYLINAIESHDDQGLVNPYCLKEPLAPSVAAAREGVNIDIDRIKKCYHALSGKHDITIVEGIGGLLVPIRDDYFVSDMILDLDLPVILVTRPGLGTINHTLLTTKHLNHIGAQIAGIIINYAETIEQGTAEETNPSVIEQLSGARVLGVVPYIPSIDSHAQKTKDIKAVFEQHIDLASILKYVT